MFRRSSVHNQLNSVTNPVEPLIEQISSKSIQTVPSNRIPIDLTQTPLDHVYPILLSCLSRVIRKKGQQSRAQLKLLSGIRIRLNSTLCLLCFLFIFALLSIPVAMQSSPTFSRRKLPKTSIVTLQRLGGRSLIAGTLLTQIYDAIEIPVVQTDRELNLLYYIGRNRPFWFTVTPCTGQLQHIAFIPTTAYSRRTWNESKHHYLKLSHSVKSPMRGSHQGLRVEAFPGDSIAPKFNSSVDQTQYLNRSRVHYSRYHYPSDTLRVRLNGRQGDAFMLRFSTRSSPVHMYNGYPVLSEDSSVSGCMKNESNDTLILRWKAATPDEMNCTYCISINSEENLPYRCSAMARLGQSNSGDRIKLKPWIYQKSNRLRSRLINQSVYKCFQTTKAEIQLPPSLAQALNNNEILFVNVYAVNERVDLSSSYPVLHIQRPIENCSKLRVVHHWNLRNTPSILDIFAGRDITYELPDNNTDKHLAIRVCSSIPTRRSTTEAAYSVRLFKERNSHYPYGGKKKPENCNFSISDNTAIQFCTHKNKSTGLYRLRLDGESTSTGTRLARLFYYDVNNYDQRPTHTTFGTRINGLYTERPIRRVRSYEQWDENRWLKDVNGLQLGADCPPHQVRLNLTIHSMARHYWIYTVPLNHTLVNDNSEKLFARLNELTDHCGVKTEQYEKLLMGNWTITMLTSKQGENHLITLLNAQKQDDKPRYYLLLVYASIDIGGYYQELFTQAVFDVCYVTRKICYKNYAKCR